MSLKLKKSLWVLVKLAETGMSGGGVFKKPFKKVLSVAGFWMSIDLAPRIRIFLMRERLYKHSVLSHMAGS